MPLDPEDVERLAISGYLIGKDAQSSDLLARAHHDWVARGACERAARCAFWLFFILYDKGQQRAAAAGSRGRAGSWTRGNATASSRAICCCRSPCRPRPGRRRRPPTRRSSRPSKIGDRFGETDLWRWPGGRGGRCRSGEIDEGVALLDEVMVAVTAGELSPIRRRRLLQRHRDVPGNLRSAPGAGVDGCAQRVVRLSARPGAVSGPVPGSPGRNHAAARRVARRPGRGARACEWLSDRPGSRRPAGLLPARRAVPVARRVAKAEEAYRQAGRLGPNPQPGLALLRLAQGQTAARAAICRAVEEAQEPRARTGSWGRR